MTETFRWQAADGQSMHGCIWPTEGEAKGTVCLVHGLGEHIGRYEHVAKALNEAGWDVAGFDQRGHGRSGGRRGVIPSYASLLDDTRLFLVRQRHRQQGKSVALYGHSMGGNLVLNFLLQKPGTDLPQKAIVTSPALQLPVSNSQIILSKWASKILPHVTMKNGIPASKLSRDRAVVEAYQQDPLVHDRISLLLAHCLFHYGEHAMNCGDAISVPTLLLHGRADAVCLIGGSETLATAASQIDFRTWEEGFHELHNEPNREEILQTIVQWLNE